MIAALTHLVQRQTGDLPGESSLQGMEIAAMLKVRDPETLNTTTPAWRYTMLPDPPLPGRLPARIPDPPHAGRIAMGGAIPARRGIKIPGPRPFMFCSK
jgi:hypothetical protein